MRNEGRLPRGKCFASLPRDTKFAAILTSFFDLFFSRKVCADVYSYSYC